MANPEPKPVAEVSARISGRMLIVVVPATPPPPTRAGAAVRAINWATPGPAAAPSDPPRNRREAPAVMAPTAPVYRERLWLEFGLRVSVLPPAAKVRVPSVPAWRVRRVPEAVAVALSVSVVAPVIAEIVVPEGIPTPETTMPGTNPTVLVTVTALLLLVTLPALRETMPPRDSVVAANALPLIWKEPPARVRVTPAAPITTPFPRRLLTF